MDAKKQKLQEVIELLEREPQTPEQIEELKKLINEFLSLPADQTQSPRPAFRFLV